MSKALKKLMAQELTRRLGAVDSFIIFNYQGLKAQELFELRRALLKENVTVKVVKNKVATFSLSAKVSKDITKLFKGPIAMAHGGDVVRVAQLLLDWNKKSPKKVEIKGGHIPGKVLNAKEVEALAKVPPRPAMLSILAGGFIAPMRQIATITIAPIQKMSYGLTGLIKKMEEQKVEKVSDLK